MKLRTMNWMAAGILAFAVVSCNSYYNEHLAGAAAGKAEDQYAIGMCYLEGTAPGGGVNKAQAVEWFMKAAQQGNGRAQNKLGQMYQKGEGVPQSNEKAIQWYKRAALQGYSEAQYNLGELYGGLDQSGGFDVASAEHRRYIRLEEEAAKWYRMAAERGHADAQHELGLIYIRAAINNQRSYGPKYNLDGDSARYRETGIDWLRKAAAQGDPTHIKKYQWHCNNPNV